MVSERGEMTVVERISVVIADIQQTLSRYEALIQLVQILREEEGAAVKLGMRPTVEDPTSELNGSQSEGFHVQEVLDLKREPKQMHHQKDAHQMFDEIPEGNIGSTKVRGFDKISPSVEAKGMYSLPSTNIGGMEGHWKPWKKKGIGIRGPIFVSGEKKDLYVKGFQKNVIWMGKRQEKVEDVPCGKIVAMVGLDQFITKKATLTSEKEVEAQPICAMKFCVSPVVCVAVSCKVASDLPKLVEGIKRMTKSDPKGTDDERIGPRFDTKGTDLPLNNSIETLQQNKILKIMEKKEDCNKFYEIQKVSKEGLEVRKDSKGKELKEAFRELTTGVKRLYMRQRNGTPFINVNLRMEVFEHQPPLLNLEDKVVFKGGGNVTNDT